jgi:hypothetical protein
MVRVMCLTDPADAASWAAEPARRRLEVEFGGDVAITYVMAGLAREFADPAAHARAILEAAASSGMPVDVRPWLGGAGGRAPRSSYPACLAVKAAAEQGRDGAVLRRLREGFLLDGRAQDTTDALLAAVRGVPGLDLDRFGVDLRSNAIVEAFGADLDVAREHERPLPSWRVGERWLEGETGVTALREAARAAGAKPAGPLPSAEDAVRRLGPVATAEVAAVCDLPGPRAPAELWRLAAEWRVRARPVLGGELWSAA